MKMGDFTPDEIGFCSCGERGVYPRTNGKSSTVYWSCRECFRKRMKKVMRNRYATVDGKKAINAANHRWYMKHRSKHAIL